MKNWTPPHWITLLLSVFFGAAGPFALNAIVTGGMPHTSAQWASLAIGALVAGLAAIKGIYLTPPTPPSDGAALGIDKLPLSPPSLPPRNSVRETLHWPKQLRAGMWAAAVLAGAILVGGMAGGLTGCGWWAANSNTVVRDAGQIGSCVLAQLFSGASDAGTVVKACDGATFSDVEALIASLIDFYSKPGVSEPAPGMLVRLRVAHHEVKARIARGEK